MEPVIERAAVPTATVELTVAKALHGLAHFPAGITGGVEDLQDPAGAHPPGDAANVPVTWTEGKANPIQILNVTTGHRLNFAFPEHLTSQSMSESARCNPNRERRPDGERRDLRRERLRQRLSDASVRRSSAERRHSGRRDL